MLVIGSPPINRGFNTAEDLATRYVDVKISFRGFHDVASKARQYHREKTSA